MTLCRRYLSHILYLLILQTCDNFLLLCESGYYKNTLFHRVVPNFCIQGGDPTGTGRGGESAWGGMFEDEFHPNITHQFPYTLSMANAGPNTNKSQLYDFAAVFAINFILIIDANSYYSRTVSSHSKECLTSITVTRPSAEWLAAWKPYSK